jgi:hypothetical protein
MGESTKVRWVTPKIIILSIILPLFSHPPLFLVLNELSDPLI